MPGFVLPWKTPCNLLWPWPEQLFACFSHCNVMTKQLRNLLFAGLAVVLAVACSKPSPTALGGDPIVLGYSNWAGWWPWAIAVEEKLFEKNGVNVEMKWFDGYVQSMETFAAGKIDGNSQTLNDTISFLPGENGGQVVVLVNDN